MQLTRRVRGNLGSGYHAIRAAARRLVGFPVVQNVNSANIGDHTRRALLVYLVRPFRLRDDDPRFFSHQNLKQCKQIASVLGELGYVVDVADVEDRKFRPSSRYDLVISHRVDLDGAAIQDAVRVYLATGMNHKIHNLNMRKRYDDLYRRRGFRLLVRGLHAEIMPFLDKASALVGFGNEHTVGTWRGIFDGPSYAFNNYGFQTTTFVNRRRYDTARKNFLFFASQNQVGKGLDLLLEIISKHPSLNLYVCSDFENEPDFCSCYHKELFDTPQVHPVGRIRVGSAYFYELAEHCAFAILPTCSEGSVGSVVQCMFTGLIPIVTREAGIDAEGFGINLVSSSLDEIERAIMAVSELPEEWHKYHSLRTREIAEVKYSETVFVKRWRTMMTEIVAKRGLSP